MRFNIPTIDIENRFYFYTIETMSENRVSKQQTAHEWSVFFEIQLYGLISESGIIRLSGNPLRPITFQLFWLCLFQVYSQNRKAVNRGLFTPTSKYSSLIFTQLINLCNPCEFQILKVYIHFALVLGIHMYRFYSS